MKRTRKKVFGFLGLLAVAATTFFAASLPVPETSATTTSVTDNIVVRVVDGGPEIGIINMTNGELTTVPSENFSVQFANIGVMTVTITHTDMDGVTDHTETALYDTGYARSQVDFNVNIIK